MDATLNIIVKVAARQAQKELAGTAAAITGVQNAAKKTGLKNMTQQLKAAAKANANFAANINNSLLIKHGKNINWVGRQLTYNFTLPLVLAGAALFKFNQNVERSMVQVRKVYGDLGMSQKQVNKETELLSKSFELLSSRFGVIQTDVIDIAAGFASAGSAGRGLAENTKAALELMILGEMEAAEATDALIAIQAQWRLSTLANEEGVSELTEALAVLNIVENETAIKMADLTEVFQKSSGVARAGGVSIRELAAMAAALVPAAGNASEAGNMLKTVISRMGKPTREMIDVLEKMGIVVSDPEWMGSTATEKLQTIADEFQNLSSAQRDIAASALAGRRQVSRFNILMQDMGEETGFYAKAMEASSDEIRNLEYYQKELNAVLESNPRKWDIMTNAMRNSLATAFIPLMPAIFSLVMLFSRLAKAFSELNPDTQKLILFGLAALAIAGPILSLIGSVMQLIGVIGVFAKMFTGVAAVLSLLFGAIGKAFVLGLVRPILMGLGYLVAGLAKAASAMVVMFAKTAAAAAAAAIGIVGPLWVVVAVIVAVAATIALILKTDIEDPFIRVFQNIVDAIAQLPSVFARVFRAVIDVLARAIEIVIEYLSYLNPFARHSPSLVDNVKAGISVILSEYSKLSTIPEIVARALASLAGFKGVSMGDMASFREAELNDQVSQISEYNPAAGSAAADMVDSILELEAVLPGLSAAIAKQRLEVERLTHEYEKAVEVLDAATEALRDIQSQMSDVADQLGEANDRLDELANMKITGMTAMEDAIFANRMEQKKLNLELIRFEQAGHSIDSIRNKMALLNGDIEMLRGEQESLRMKGAGSDVLGFYDDQIAALESQKGPLEGIAKEITDVEDRLAALELEGRALELTYSITYDPLLREIDKLVNGIEEMGFDEIVLGIKEQQAIVKELEKVYNDLAAAEKAAQEAVDDAQESRDEIKDQLDEEQAALDNLVTMYEDIVALIRDMESAMSSYLSAAEAAAQIESAKKTADAATGSGSGQSPIQDLFDAAAAGDYDLQGGGAVLGAEGDAFDIEQFNKDLDQALQDALEGMGAGLEFPDLWGAITGFFGRVGTWIRENLPAIIVGALAWGVGGGLLLAAFGPKVWDWAYANIIEPIGDALSPLLELLNQWVVQPVAAAFGAVGGLLRGIWNGVIYPVLRLMGDVFDGLGEAISFVWKKVIWPAISYAWGLIEGAFNDMMHVVDNYFVPMWQALAVSVQIVWRLISIAIEVAGLFMKWVWETIVEPALGALVGVFEWVGEAIGTVFTDLGSGVWDLWTLFMEPALDAIEVAFDATWQFLAGLAEGFGDLFSPVWDAMKGIYTGLIKPVLMAIGLAFASVWNGVISVTSTAVNFFIDAFNLIAGAINSIAGLLGISSRVSVMTNVNWESVKFNAGMFAAADEALNGPRAPSGGGGGVLAMAEGGVLGRMGGITKETRAIVGEGSDIHPEYVIPTDPQYRDRAKGLYNRLGATLGMGEDGLSHMDLFGSIGGAIGSGFDFAKDAVGKVGGVIKDGAVWALWNPAKAAINALLNMIPEGFIRDIGKGVLGGVDSWVRGADSAWNEEAASRKPPVPVNGAGSWHVIPAMLKQMGIPFKFLSGYRPGARTRNTGNVSWHALDRAVDLGSNAGSFPSSYSPSELKAINHAIYDAYKPQLKELIYGGPGAKNVFRGRDHNFSAKLMNEHVNHVHAALARGGFVVPRAPGGNLFRIGEGLHDESVQVTPLTSRDRDVESGTVNNFYGELVFPNIENGDDAEEFIRNLEVLTK